MTVPRNVIMLSDNWRYDGSSHQIRRRSKRSPQGRRRAHSRQGPLHRRPFAAARDARADAALAACACEIHHQRHQGPRDAGRVADPDRRRRRDLGDLPCLFNLEVDPFTGPPYPILAEGRGAPCRRRRGLRGRRHHRPGPRRDRGDRGRTGRRCRRWSASPTPSSRARRRSGPTSPAMCCSTCRSATRRRPKPPLPRRMRSPK